MPASLDDLPELADVPAVAEYLGVGLEAVRRMLRDGRLTGVFLGRSWRIPKSELRRFVEQRGAERKRGPRRRDEAHGSVPLAGGRVHPGSEAEPAEDDEEPEQRAAALSSKRWMLDGPASTDVRYRVIG